MSTRRAVGIDLGTARTVVARVDQHGRSLMFRDAQGDLLIPSVVYFEDDEWLAGRAAKLAAAAVPSRAAEYYKRDLGQAAYARAIGGELLPPEVVEACLIKRLLDEVRVSDGADHAVVLSMPASFNLAQRLARLDAARLAGADVAGSIHDPLAAALSFAESQGYLNRSATGKPDQRLLVFDLGANKLDVAVIEIRPGHLRTVSLGGNMNLGGRDWDARLAEHLAEQFAHQFSEDPRHDLVSVRRLLETAEETKQSLTVRQQAPVQVQRGQDSVSLVVTRQVFEELTADLLEDALQNVTAVLARADVNWRDLDGVLAVGGATRMPALMTRLKQLSGREPIPNLQPDEAVARGAALYAEHLLAAREGRGSPIELTITDVSAHSLGMRRLDSHSDRRENIPLIPRGSELPCGVVTRVATVTDGQTAIELELLEGESRDADKCVRNVSLSIRELPAHLPAGTQVNLQCQLTAEGRLHVTAHLARTGQPLPVSLKRANSLSEQELSECQQWITQGGGLTTLRTLAARQNEQRRERNPVPTVVPPALPPPIKAAAVPPELPNVAPRATFDWSLEADPSAPLRRLRRRRMTPRKLLILLGGYLVSALLGTAIGYYILMRMDPSYNWWDLRLPGLQAPPAGARSDASLSGALAPFAPLQRRSLA
jgi:molecular chaperone DnaK